MIHLRNLVLGIALICHAVMALPAERTLISPALEPFPQSFFNELNACVTGGTVTHEQSWAVRQLTLWYRAFSSSYFTALPATRSRIQLAKHPALQGEIRRHILQVRQHANRTTEEALIASLDREVHLRGRAAECETLVGQAISQIAMQRDYALAWADAIEIVAGMEQSTKAASLQFQQLKVEEGLDQITLRRAEIESFVRDASPESDPPAPVESGAQE